MTLRFCWSCVSILMPPCVPHSEHFPTKTLATALPPHPVPEEGYNLEKISIRRGSFCFSCIDGTSCCGVRQRLSREISHNRSHVERRRLAAPTRTTHFEDNARSRRLATPA